MIDPFRGRPGFTIVLHHWRPHTPTHSNPTKREVDNFLCAKLQLILPDPWLVASSGKTKVGTKLQTQNHLVSTLTFPRGDEVITPLPLWLCPPQGGGGVVGGPRHTHFTNFDHCLAVCCTAEPLPLFVSECVWCVQKHFLRALSATRFVCARTPLHTPLESVWTCIGCVARDVGSILRYNTRTRP